MIFKLSKWKEEELPKDASLGSISTSALSWTKRQTRRIENLALVVEVEEDFAAYKLATFASYGAIK